MDFKAWTVCIVEPNKFERQIMIDLLRNAGVDRVKAYERAQDAIEVLETYNANVVIASFEMGEIDGAAWTKAFRRNKKLAQRKAAIFITSAAFSLNMAEQCRHAGANALIGKPLSAKVLLATITKVLTKPREFIDAEGYVGPCRRAGIVTAGAPRKRRTADTGTQNGDAQTLTLAQAVAGLCATAASMLSGAGGPEGCEPPLRLVQAYAVNAGDGPLMRACAALALQLTATRTQLAEAWRPAIEVAVQGVAQLAELPTSAETAERRETIAEQVRQAVAKAATLRAA